jgi:hypothetical protein
VGGVKQAMINSAKGPAFDHFDTPEYAVRPLLPYIPKNLRVWEPTDTFGKSGITAALKKNGVDVASTGKERIDFLRGEPDFPFDCVVTNPPYSIKDAFIDRCVYFKKPFALLLPITALEGIDRGRMFRAMGSEFGVLVLDRRVEFTGKSVWFNTSWFCYGLLPERLMFAELKKEFTHETLRH